MNEVAERENFKDAGEMWRNTFEDDDFLDTVDRLWKEVKPLYKILHRYVRVKLKDFYQNDIETEEEMLPGHVLGMFVFYMCVT